MKKIFFDCVAFKGYKMSIILCDKNNLTPCMLHEVKISIFFEILLQCQYQYSQRHCGAHLHIHPIFAEKRGLRNLDLGFDPEYSP